MNFNHRLWLYFQQLRPFSLFLSLFASFFHTCRAALYYYEYHFFIMYHINCILELTLKAFDINKKTDRHKNH